MESTVDRETVDRKEADFINFLVDEKCIDPKRISEADKVIVRELLERNKEQIAKFGTKSTDGQTYSVPQEYRDKIKTLLGYREKQTPEEINKNLEIAQEIIKKLSERSGFAVTGAIVCGSRVDVNKIPRQNSDLDLCIYVDTADFSKMPTSKFLKAIDEWNETIAQAKYPFQVMIDDVYDQRDLSGVLDTDKEGYSVPFWAWNPESFQFVGSFNIEGVYFDGKQATDYVKNIFRSDKMDSKREENIRTTENAIAILMSKQSLS